MVTSLFISLILTLIIENIISIMLGVKSYKDMKVVVLVNICTNPVLVYIANCLMLFSNGYIYNVVIIIMEIVVVIIEGYLYKRCLQYYKKSPFALSLINNVVSYSLGLILNNII